MDFVALKGNGVGNGMEEAAAVDGIKAKIGRLNRNSLRLQIASFFPYCTTGNQMAPQTQFGKMNAPFSLPFVFCSC